MRLPRLTTRRLMVLVAGAALFLGAVRLWQLRVAYRGLMAAHATNEARFRDREIWVIRISRSANISQQQVDYSWKRVSYHAALRRKCERAARYPWLPVPPDPPPPE